jgi:hypothetical protein
MDESVCTGWGRQRNLALFASDFFQYPTPPFARTHHLSAPVAAMASPVTMAMGFRLTGFASPHQKDGLVSFWVVWNHGSGVKWALEFVTVVTRVGCANDRK